MFSTEVTVTLRLRVTTVSLLLTINSFSDISAKIVTSVLVVLLLPDTDIQYCPIQQQVNKSSTFAIILNVQHAPGKINEGNGKSLVTRYIKD